MTLFLDGVNNDFVHLCHVHAHWKLNRTVLVLYWKVGVQRLMMMMANLFLPVHDTKREHVGVGWIVPAPCRH